MIARTLREHKVTNFRLQFISEADNGDAKDTHHSEVRVLRCNGEILTCFEKFRAGPGSPYYNQDDFRAMLQELVKVANAEGYPELQWVEKPKEEPKPEPEAEKPKAKRKKKA